MSQAENTTNNLVLELSSETSKRNANPSAQSVFAHDFKLTMQDIFSGVGNYHAWTFMGFSEIRRRYRRTVIGPFWTSLSVGIFISCMGILLSNIWNTPSKDFLPYFCSGYICWTLIQYIINDGCITFTGAESFIRQVSLPYTLYSCIIVWRNIIVFFHHLVVMALVLLYAGVPINFNFLYIFPGLLILFVTGLWVTMFLGMICARYRDIQQVISSLLQLAMFVTPIMWKPHQLGRKGLLVADLNPLHHFISIIRLPLIGEAPSALNWTVSASIMLIGALATTLFLAKNYRRLVFWL